MKKYGTFIMLMMLLVVCFSTNVFAECSHKKVVTKYAEKTEKASYDVYGTDVKHSHKEAKTRCRKCGKLLVTVSMDYIYSKNGNIVNGVAIQNDLEKNKNQYTLYFLSGTKVVKTKPKTKKYPEFEKRKFVVMDGNSVDGTYVFDVSVNGKPVTYSVSFVVKSKKNIWTYDFGGKKKKIKF